MLRFGRNFYDHMKTYFLALLIVLPICVKAQTKKAVPADLLKKINAVNKVANQLDARNPYADTLGDIGIDALDSTIARGLLDILKDKRAMTEAVEQAFRSISVTTSEDKQLKIFYWYQNTGGSCKAYSSVVQYRTPVGVVGAYHLSANYEDCVASGGTFSRIHTLTTGKKNLYLAFELGMLCHTCEHNKAAVFQLTDKGLITNYPAFEDSTPCFEINNRMGNAEVFEYDPVTKELKVSYIKDDLSDEGEYADNAAAKERVHLTFQFDGLTFKQVRR